MLNIYETVLRGTSDPASLPRWRIEHVQVLQPADIPRFHTIGIIPGMQPTHATSDMPWAGSRLGKERITGAYAWRSILKTGSMIVGGSDFPIEHVNPLLGIYAAVTRCDTGGNPPGGWFPEQTMTRGEALRAFTLWAAIGSFQEHTKGTIEPGKWADLTVLSGDILTMNAADIPRTEVVMTIVGGRIVYRNPSLATPF
jgi:predicted amidohydrolase YtcJ